MSSFNRVIIAGNLTRDPELKQVGQGQSLCKLGLASNRQYKNRQTGSMIQEVCYVDIDVWGAQAESCHKFLQKGKPVLVEGRLKLDSWKDNDGQNRSKHSIVADRVVFLGAGGPQVDTESVQDESGLDKDLLDRLNEIKKSKEQDSEKLVAATTSKPRKKKVEQAPQEDVSDLPEVEFKDEPPFADDLPF